MRVWDNVRFLAAALLLLLASGCGEKPAPAPAPEPAAATPRQNPTHSDTLDTRARIVTFGNSLTSGVGDNGSYPTFLQQDLDQAGYKWRVINEGVPGDTTTNGLARVTSVLAHEPQIVVLEFGGNDGLRGVPVASTRANLDSMIRQLRERNITIVLAGITLPPNYGVEYIKPFEKMYRDLASEYHLAFLPFLLEGVALVEGMMSQDGIHPTLKGNQRVAQNVFNVLKPLLDRSAGRVGAEHRTGAGHRR